MTKQWHPCSYRVHRESDWLLTDGSGPVTCGVCHPPVSEDVVRRIEPGWNKALRQRDRAIAAYRRRLSDPFDVHSEVAS